MKKFLILIILICFGSFQTCFPWNVSYAMKNEMSNPTTKITFDFTNFDPSKKEDIGETYKTIIDFRNKPGGIQPGEILGWVWENEQKYPDWGLTKHAFITNVTVEWSEPDPKDPTNAFKFTAQSKTTPQDKIYGDMDWLIRKDGSLIRLKNGSLANRDTIDRIEDDGNNKTGTVVLKDGTRIPFQ